MSILAEFTGIGVKVSYQINEEGEMKYGIHEGRRALTEFCSLMLNPARTGTLTIGNIELAFNGSGDCSAELLSHSLVPLPNTTYGAVIHRHGKREDVIQGLGDFVGSLVQVLELKLSNGRVLIWKHDGLIEVGSQNIPLKVRKQ